MYKVSSLEEVVFFEDQEHAIYGQIGYELYSVYGW